MGRPLKHAGGKTRQVDPTWEHAGRPRPIDLLTGNWASSGGPSCFALPPKSVDCGKRRHL